MTRPTVLFGATTPDAVWHFLKDQVVYLTERGWEVHVVVSPDPGFERLEDFFASYGDTHLHAILMRREATPIRDLRALVAWIAVLWRVKPHIVVAGTPKAGLLGVLAAWLTRVPERIYQLRGLRFQTQQGIARRVGWVAEWIAASGATSILCNSPSLREEVSVLRLARPQKTVVLNSGSSHGVDATFFCPGSGDQRRKARERFGIPKGDVVIGFAGRLSKDKGVAYLLEAFAALRADQTNVWLLAAGASEDANITQLLSASAQKDDHILAIDWLTDMRNLYWAIDIFCLPSLREGLPNVNLEAAACELPVITTTATGCCDSVVHEFTGLLVPPADAPHLMKAMSALVKDPQKREAMGIRGRAWVIKHFDEMEVQQSLEGWLSSLVSPPPEAPGL